MRCLGLMLLAVITAFLVSSVSLGTVSAEAGGDFAERYSGMVKITDVRIGSSSDNVRLVVDADREITYKQLILSNPNRVVIDIVNAWLAPSVSKSLPAQGELASAIRVAQFDKRTVRIVVETSATGSEINTFALKGGKVPGRVVLDLGAGFRDSSKPPKDNTPKVDTATDVDDTKNEDTADSKAEPENADAEDNEGDEVSQPQKPIDIYIEDDKPLPKDENENKAIAAITSLEGKTIVIDPGHGGSDPGAIGPSGVMEKTVTLNVSRALKKILEAEGAKVIMTRNADVEVHRKKVKATDVEELEARCRIANRAKADIFVSIHIDGFINREANGTTVYYYAKGSKDAKRLADNVRSALVAEMGTKDRGTQVSNFYVVKNTTMPAILVEVGFISNPREEKLLNSRKGVQSAAQGIADGIADYFG